MSITGPDRRRSSKFRQSAEQGAGARHPPLSFWILLGPPENGAGGDGVVAGQPASAGLARRLRRRVQARAFSPGDVAAGNSFSLLLLLARFNGLTLATKR